MIAFQAVPERFFMRPVVTPQAGVPSVHLHSYQVERRMDTPGGVATTHPTLRGYLQVKTFNIKGHRILMYCARGKDKPMSTVLRIPTKTPQSIHASRLIIATNRGPVEYYLSQEQELKHRRGPGGVVTALTGANSRMDVTWVAMAMTEADRIAAKEAQQHEGVMRSPLPGQNMLLRYVTITKKAYRKTYEEISNQLLWFVQHYLYDPMEDSQFAHKLQDAWKNGYTVANRAMADAVSAEIDRGEGTTVEMLNDYHLFIAYDMLRAM